MIMVGVVLLVIGGFGVNKILLGQYCDDFKNYQMINQLGVIGDGILLV